MKISALILAAGAGSRLGLPKALMKIGELTALDRALQLFEIPEIYQTVVVLGAQADEIVKNHHLDQVDAVVNKNWSRGMLSSYQWGLKTFQDDPDFVICHLVDMPLVQAETIRSLMLRSLFSQLPLIVPYYEQMKGHPVVWQRDLYKMVEKLDFAKSAREVTAQFQNQIDLVEVNDPGILFDVDSAEDLKRAQEVSNLIKEQKQKIEYSLLENTDN